MMKCWPVSASIPSITMWYSVIVSTSSSVSSGFTARRSTRLWSISSNSTWKFGERWSLVSVRRAGSEPESSTPTSS